MNQIETSAGSPNTHPVPAKKAPRPPKYLELGLCNWDGRLSCAYLNDYRIVGGKPWGGGETAYTWHIRVEQLKAVLEDAARSGASTVRFEVYQHRNEEMSLYINDVLMLGKRDNARSCQSRRVGSVIVMQFSAVNVSDFASAHPALKVASD